ncbi:helix-turn-helix domain-containing protein [Halomicrobium urmianum]|uniref:helix-turn-helix domain-containing protein n=1 Tax=Halomicrobium urmianum TaxID=1586233 RepID=UPI001CDA047D|nr:helix-turn-helix domain-containing protein [Halomicrobium urmianum]
MEDRNGDRPQHGPPANDDSGDSSPIGSASNPPERQGGDVPECVINGEFALSHPTIALTPATEELTDVVLRPEHVVPDPDGPFLVFSAYGDDLDAFERALDTDATVSDPRALSHGRGARSYRVTLAGEAVTVPQLVVRNGARLVDAEGSNGEWEVRAQFPNRTVFTRFRADCVESEIDLSLHRLYWDDANTYLQRSVLTGKQRDTLERAYEAGYFDVPRRISQSELADKLDISSSAVSQRIRRATGRLIETNLDTDDA